MARGRGGPWGEWPMKCLEAQVWVGGLGVDQLRQHLGEASV